MSGVYRINGYNSVRRINTKRVSAGAVSWWLAGGIDPANCIAAYQAKGAASYAASKVNLANPGTYDATEGGVSDVVWDSVNGWYQNPSYTDYYFTTGIYPNSGWSFAISFAGINNTSNGGLMGVWSNTNQMFAYNPYLSSNRNMWGNGGYRTAYIGNLSTGVVVSVEGKLYRNGVLDDTCGAWSGGASPHEIYICRFNNYNQVTCWGGYIESIAIYNTTLTTDQISALTTAMNAL